MVYQVLIVEDQPLNLELATFILESEGFKVLSARTAEECSAVLGTQHPDLVLMDIQLPGKDGLQITRELRANPATRDLLIVALTAYAMVGDEQRILEAGCDGYLAKPISSRRLVDEVRALLERKNR